MAPVASGESQVQMTMVPTSGPGPPGSAGSISLGMLVDFIIQRTYHDLTVLSELLPRKTDMERKIAIVQFAHRTRQLFVRLLALVKWANSAAKVDKCAMISAFLDQQAMIFVDTADMLYRMVRELVHARLPSFNIPHAVDVLTTGTYPRLPKCIRDRIVPPDPITPAERKATLLRLNQIIQHRLVTTDLPPQLGNLTIANGRVKFQVSHEFEATLTLMGDEPAIPWRLLGIKILVEDKDTGNGTALVHSLQVNYIHQLIQSRLFADDRPLYDLYDCLHSFCQSLQLEVLHSQTQRLIHERWSDHIRLEEYTIGQSLTVSYWRAQLVEAAQNKLEIPVTHKLTIAMHDNDKSRPLQVKHQPPLPSHEPVQVDHAIKSDCLSMEKLLVQTVQARAYARLKELQLQIKAHNRDDQSLICGIPPVLKIPILYPCTEVEYMNIVADLQTGMLQPMFYHGESHLEEMEKNINSDASRTIRMVSDLRFVIARRRCQHTVLHLPTVCHRKLHLENFQSHPISKLSSHKVYLRLTRHPGYYLVVEFLEGQQFYEIEYRYHLLQLKDQSVKLKAEGESSDSAVSSHAGSLVTLDPATFSKEVGTATPGIKRKISIQHGHGGPQLKRERVDAGEPSMYLPDVAHLISVCDTQIPLISLCQELGRRGIPCQGVQSEGYDVGLGVKLLALPSLRGIPDHVVFKLRSDCLGCTFRLQGKTSRVWTAELVFANCQLVSTTQREQTSSRHVYFTYDGLKPESEPSSSNNTENANITLVMDKFMQDWHSIAEMYATVLDFARNYKDPNRQLFQMVEVKSFSYKRLTLSYGVGRSSTVKIQWVPGENGGSFKLGLGMVGRVNNPNCHMVVQSQLQEEFNTHHNIAQLIQVLCETQSPLQSIIRLPQTTILGCPNKPLSPTQTFTILPQSSDHVRIAFRNLYCLDVHCRGRNLVAIRDGAYSLFDVSKVVEGFTPTQGLKAFLSMFEDSMAHSRRRSASEDDNPPSPIGMDKLDTYMTQHQLHHQTTGASPLPRTQPSAYHPMNPMTPPTSHSNPATPASPHTSMLATSQSYSTSPGSAYPLASPPQLTPQHPNPGAPITSAPTPSPSMLYGTPSPSTFTSSSPSVRVPSPSSFVPAPSPQSMGIHMGPSPAFMNPTGPPSPFHAGLTMPSPGTRNPWPGSPSMPGPSPVSRVGMASPGVGSSMLSPPSRILPQRSWAASIPTLLSHEAFATLMTPSPPPGVMGGPAAYLCCPLERFLGCVYMRRHLQRVIQGEESLHLLPSSEPGVILYHVESINFRVQLNPSTLQTLHLKATPRPEAMEMWSREELNILESFFDTKVVCPPYKANTLTAFGRLLCAPTAVLRDCIQLMRLELFPDQALKWHLQWCLTIPPSGSPLAPPGTPAVVIRTKILFFIQLTRMGMPPSQDSTVVVPILYDPSTNTTQQADISNRAGASGGAAPPNALSGMVGDMLKRWASFSQGQQGNDCTIFPAIRDLLHNLIPQ
ncbi:Hypp7387 [Branchiostoma lanceolatum]|uniref:Mediator of RNA polymerase II transcription subunit 14 n=1 Tax=Branchiostoma lanceolatum TaxID=7740 RepID=A0A8J9YZK2_BRALA|nr:Hypp7387 [Branchiostoma lanceolatum]